MKRIFTVTGMSCAACSARVEKAVRGVPGVEDCAVSPLTDEMSVEGPADDAAVVAAVEAAGYGAAPAGPAGATPRGDGEGDARSVPDRAETRALRIRLASSLALLGVLMYATMGHMMLGWPLPAWFTQPEPNHVAMGLAQLLLSGAVLALNGRHFFFPPAPRLCVLCVPPFAFFAFSSWEPRGQPHARRRVERGKS